MHFSKLLVIAHEFAQQVHLTKLAVGYNTQQQAFDAKHLQVRSVSRW